VTPDDLPPFRPRFPWWGGDLQTLASRFLGPVSLRPHDSERLRLPLNDGTGDTLLATLDRPASPIPGRPLAILVHGLTGSEDSHYMLSQSRLLLDRGYRVLRLNLRGAGPSRPLCGEQYYAGRSEDFRAALSLLPEDLKRDGLFAVGYSLGGAMLLKYLGEEGRATPLTGAAIVSAPIDLAITCRNMMRARNAIYHRYILRQMKIEATAPGSAVTAAERAAILKSSGVWEYDDVFIAPRYGFGSAERYYELCRPLRFMPEVRIPTLVVAAMDDPWIPGRLYGSFDWKGNNALHPRLLAGGGHVGFHGTGSAHPWSDQAVCRFLASGS
jgi:hypothetical protein